MTDGGAPLHDLAVEESVLAGCMTNSESLWSALSLGLEPVDFYSEQHRCIWAAVSDIGNEGNGIADELQVVTWLRNQKMLAKAGGAAAVARITDTFPSSALIETHVEMMKTLRRSRDIRKMCMDVITAEDPKEQDIALERGFTNIMSASHERHTETVAQASLRFNVEDLGEAVEYPIFPRLNDKLRLRRGGMFVVAGTPGAGKTSLSLQIAANISREQPVIIASGEMRMREILERYVAMMTGYGPASLQNPRADQREVIEMTIKKLREYTQLTVMEPGFLTPSKIAGRARVEALKAGQLGLIVVDYIQLLNLPRAKGMNREQIVGEIARQCKEMAQSMNVPVIACSQLSRDHKKSKRPPDLHDLRESGAIEAHSDGVLMLDRDDDSEETLVYIRKNRFGIKGRARLRFCNGARFEEYENMTT